MELLALKPATPFDPSEGMDNLNEAKDYIRFLYNLLQEKEKLNQEMASDLKVLREELSAYRQKTEKEHDAYVDQFVRQNEALYEATQQISRLNALVVKLTEQLEVQKKQTKRGAKKK